VITSTRHPVVAAFRRLAAAPRRDDAPRGDAARRILLDGRRLIAEALDAGVVIEQVLLAADPSDARSAALGERLRAAGACVHAASPRVVQAAAGVETSQGIVATAQRPALADAALLAAPDLFLLVADQVQDPGNLGTIVRTALAAGATAVAATSGGVDPYNPKVLRATAGALFRLPVICEAAAALSRALSQRGVRVLVADARGSLDYRDVPVDRPIAIVVGNEARGPDPVWPAVGTTVRIPLFGPAESLNVAVAAALLAYEVARRGTPRIER
jgi:TrmH family RNA methyltransferase